MNRAEYKSSIFEQLDQQRKKYNSLLFPHYFRLVPERELLKCYFIENCTLGLDIEFHRNEMNKARLLYETIQQLEGDLRGLDPRLIRTSSDLDSLKSVINGLISIMIPNGQMMGLLREAYEKEAQSLKEGKPILFIEKDLIDSFCRIFWQAIPHLEQLLDDQPTELRVLYAASQIRKLDYLAVSGQKYGEDLSQCIANLRKVFECEMNHKLNQDQCRQLPIEHFLARQTEEKIIEIITFGYKKSPDFLLPFLEALNLKIGFLDDRTSVGDFMRIVSSANLGEITEKIYLGCQTNEFRYVIKYLKPFFRSFTPAMIGKSGIFISNLGNPITAGCIYSSKIDNLQVKLGIDNIFNKAQ